MWPLILLKAGIGASLGCAVGFILGTILWAIALAMPTGEPDFEGARAIGLMGLAPYIVGGTTLLCAIVGFAAGAVVGRWTECESQRRADYLQSLSERNKECDRPPRDSTP